MSNHLDTSQPQTYIQFLISIKRRQIEDFKEKMGQLEDNKRQLIKLQEQLREEQTDLVHQLQKKTLEQDRNMEKIQQEKEDQVEQMVQKDLELKHKQEKELKELRCKLARMHVQMEKQQEELEAWLRYKNEDSIKDQQKIQKLENDIALSQRTYQDILDYFQKSLVTTIEKNNQKIEKIAKEGYQLAFERAKENLHNFTSQVEKNHLLKEEVLQYRKVVAELESTIHQLEEENLEHVCMTYADDALISQGNEFLAQSARFGSHDAENMDRNVMRKSSEETTEPTHIPQHPIQTGTEGPQPNTDETSFTCDLSEMFSIQAKCMEPMHLEKRPLCVIGKPSHLHPPHGEEMTFDLQQTEKFSVITKHVIKSNFQLPVTQFGESDASEEDTCEIQQEFDENLTSKTA